MTYHQISHISSKKWYLISQRNEFSFRFWTDRETSVTKIGGICEQCKEKKIQKSRNPSAAGAISKLLL
jgi:hypothetical protein